MKKYKQETWIGLFMIIGLASVVYLAVQLGNVSLFGTNTYPLKADFTTVGALRSGNSVTLMGIDIGQVTGMSIDEDRRLAIVHFRVEKNITIYSDAIASIKTRGLIGDNYLSIDPGGAGDQLKPGGTITETVPPVNLNDVIGKFAFGSVKK
ncbi:MAG: outer membrane lipid asymmetry maintenance protein MlaD [Desulfosarcinaceae bacterium]